MKMSVYLLTGAAGFIGSHTALRLLKDGKRVIGIDNLNDYYDISLKKARLEKLIKYNNFIFYEFDIQDFSMLEKIFNSHAPSFVIHLAAQAGVRYSITNPKAYIDSNIYGFFNILEVCRRNVNLVHLVYASSSSVYGSNTTLPFSEDQNVDHPVSLYAASKKSNELMAHSYSHLYNIPTTGLRFFTVYGPWGRPDMALYLFTEAILNNMPINLFNFGNMKRDFTYIDDIVISMLKVVAKPATPNLNFNSYIPLSNSSSSPYRIFNIGNNNPTTLLDFVSIIEDIAGKKAILNLMPLQDGDVISTYSDSFNLKDWIDFTPKTDLKIGVTNFYNWYLKYYNINE